MEAAGVGAGPASTSSASLAVMSSWVDVRSGAVSSTATRATTSTRATDQMTRAARVPTRRSRAVASRADPPKPCRRTGVSTKR